MLGCIPVFPNRAGPGCAGLCVCEERWQSREPIRGGAQSVRERAVLGNGRAALAAAAAAALTAAL